MSTFEQSRSLMVQTHFTVVEIDLPSVSGTCTISGEPGFGTPLSCDQSSDGTTTYKLTQESAPLLPESGILRLIKAINETPAKLNSGRGLAGRGTGTITLFDITGKDPNPNAPGVTDEVKNQGGYLAKMAARNVLVNKNIRVKNYRVEIDGTIDLLNGAETRHYIIESMNSNKKGEWSIRFKDELSKVNLDESVWPLPLEGYLINDITDVQTTFNVDPNVTYLVDDTIRSGDELMKINAVANIGTGTANITVNGRGTQIDYTNLLSQTRKEEHSLGDEIFVCEVSDDEKIDILLARILTDVGVDASMIPVADWAAEMTLWHPNTRINTLWIESIDTFEVIEKILTDYMIDMWFDPVAREIKLSAISSWQQSTSALIEGDQIDFQTLNIKKEETLRATRAFVSYDKRHLTDDDSIESFRKTSLFTRSDLESDDLFGKPKVKKFQPTFLLDNDSAALLVNRWVNRYSDPQSRSWTTQERKLTFNVGDVVDISDLTTVNFSGAAVTTDRAQITSIKPNYKPEGRNYTVTGLAYQPSFESGTEIVINGTRSDINLHNDYAEGVPTAVNLTFIFDATKIGSTGTNLPAMRAGLFASGSVLTFILINGADLQAAGGRGGSGETLERDFEQEIWLRFGIGNGSKGGTVYDAEGVTTNIYFSGATGNANFPTADGYIRAPAGGGGGFTGRATSDSTAEAGNAGDGGNGRVGGLGGLGGVVRVGGVVGNGLSGATGGELITSPGIAWGNDGPNNNATGGAKGKGIVDSGGAVTLFGEDATRYINGGGDH